MGNVYGVVPTWLRQVSPPPPASRDHFNHCLGALGELVTWGSGPSWQTW